MMTCFATERLCGHRYLTSARLRSRGWGITLKIDDGCDWQISDSERFTISYGADGTGDLFKEANMRAFAALVEQQLAAVTPGVHGVPTPSNELPDLIFFSCLSVFLPIRMTFLET